MLYWATFTRISLIIAVLATKLIVNAIVIGEAPGFAAGTTGGGTAEPDYPKDLKELETFLGDDEPRVIVLNKEFDFLGSNGSTTEQGCRPKIMEQCIAENNGFNGQDVIIREGDTTFTQTGGCDQAVGVEVTYDNAAKNPLVVKGNKTLRGIGQAGVLKGRGLWLNGDNIIIQNIHITELNSQYVWGGDAIYMQGTESGSMKKIWLDHVKISRVGRQMLVIAFGGAESLTISNSDFDGSTDWSSSYDGHHYWAFIIGGEPTHVTFVNNYVHSTSGRSPKIVSEMGTNPIVVGHFVNNYWADNSGHSFEPGLNAFVLAEGNYFKDTKEPILADDKATVFTAADSNDCSSYLGRACVSNVVENSGKFDSVNGERAMEKVKEFKEITEYTPSKASPLSESLDNFGVGVLQSPLDSSTQGSKNESSKQDSLAQGSEQGGSKEDNPTQGSGNESSGGGSPIQHNVEQGSIGQDVDPSKCTPKRRVMELQA
ncbi:Pectin lyase [Phytophthora palmivora]|uniref:pectin lyase n=1 Tax=Phytophthora palmivora TaxID=4796 RepID=A0A2P4X479_9STRA|nr:Pectin lyase [Phytophthora palmivora]